MRECVLAFLVCPDCQKELQASVTAGSGGEILEGRLICSSCAGAYPVIRGIPHFPVSEPESPGVRRMRRRFAWQAQRFGSRGSTQAPGADLRSFVSPLGEADFEGRVVMEVGCGTGRWAIAVAGWGAREVLAVDFSEAVEAAFRNARGFRNLHVIQADLHRLPLRRRAAAQVDVGMSIGVLHPLVDPALVPALAETRPGGTVFSWVYAAEGNEWLARCLSPLRSRVTSRLPLPVVSGLALLLSAALHPLARMVARDRAHALPYRDYFEWLAALPFRHTHAVVHDQLSAPLTHYVTRAEFERWFRESDLPHPRIRHRNANSWSGLARRRPSPGAMP
jgi:SAM-dependent methyltransferase/uncharacterized protein YbaR (Trm112 family)